jgi:hypothetical protein
MGKANDDQNLMIHATELLRIGCLDRGNQRLSFM